MIIKTIYATQSYLSDSLLILFTGFFEETFVFTILFLYEAVLIKKRYPLIIISKSGGARMMEAALSLMQLAKTSAKLHKLSENKIPYISLLTDPTFGGATASFSMLGDVNIAEPKALIGFAGPRVVKETIGKDLPKGFQTSEFLLEKGFLDFIVHRKDLKVKIKKLLGFFKN